MTHETIDPEVARIAEAGRGLLDESFFDYRDILESTLVAGHRLDSVATRGLRFRGTDWSKFGAAVLKELHLFLCTDDAKYADVRERGSGMTKLALPSIAGYVAASLGVTVAAASAGVGFIALAVFKVGLNSFCRVYSSPPSTNS